MQTVNLYIDTSIKGPRRRAGCYIYLLEMKTSKGPATVNKLVCMEETTENHMTLTAMEEALKRIHKPCALHIYLECSYVAAAIQKGWLKEWQYNGFVTKRGRAVSDEEKWRRIQSLLNVHDFSIHEKEAHSYREWMERELKKGDS